jgi:hypothetical protein
MAEEAPTYTPEQVMSHTSSLSRNNSARTFLRKKITMRSWASSKQLRRTRSRLPIESWRWNSTQIGIGRPLLRRPSRSWARPMRVWVMPQIELSMIDLARRRHTGSGTKVRHSTDRILTPTTFSKLSFKGQTWKTYSVECLPRCIRWIWVVLTKVIGGFKGETLLESTSLDMEALGASQWEATVQALSLLPPSVGVLPDKGGRSRSKNKGRMWRTKEGNL